MLNYQRVPTIYRQKPNLSRSRQSGTTGTTVDVDRKMDDLYEEIHIL